MGSGLLIDDKGRVWPDNAWDLARRIGYEDPRTEIAAYAVRERGFIHIRPRRGSVCVALRERRFNLIAFTGAMLALGRMKPSPIMLALVTDGAPAFRLFSDLHDFCAEVEPLAAGEPLEIRLPRLAERRSLRVLNLAPFASVRPIIDLWEKTHGELTDEVHRAVVAGSLFHRTIVVRQLSSFRLITEHLGASIIIIRPCESLLMIGRDFDEQPDREYGAWVAQSYAETLWSGRLRVEFVRARVRTSAATILRTRYDRVLMPWRSGNDLFAMALSIQREVPVAIS